MQNFYKIRRQNIQNTFQNYFPIFLWTSSPEQSITSYLFLHHKQSDVRASNRPNADESL